MRILIDAHLSEEKTDGIGRYLNELLCALLKIDQRNEYILLTHDGISSIHKLRTLEAPNLVTIPVGLRGLDWREHFVIPRIIRQVNPDVYHHPHFNLPWFHDVPTVITIHGLKYIKHPEFFKAQSGFKRVGFKRAYMKTMMGRSIKKAQKVIAVSKSVRDDLISIFDAPLDKISIVYLGVALKQQKFVAKADVLRFYKKYGIKGKFILFVGAKLPHKNLIRLIEAFNIFRKKREGMYQLVIAGRSYSNYIKPFDKVKELALAEKVVFTEHLLNDELELMYQTAELLVFPSLYEGFGLPALEAMMNGTPVIAAGCASLPEIVGDAGILVDPLNTRDIAAAIEQVVTNPKISEKLCKMGIERVKNFTWEKTARQTLDVYNEVYRKFL